MTETKNRKCGTKIRHTSREAATAHMRSTVAGGAAEAWLNVYACDLCGCFHVGHRPGRRKS